MKSDNSNKIGAARIAAFYRIEKIHPVKMLLILCLSGSAMLFLILTLAYARTEATFFRNLGLGFPRFFSVSTVIMLINSYTISRTAKLYRKDNLVKMLAYLGITLLLSMLFVLSQVGGWYELASSGIYFRGKPYGSYLYLIPAVHVLHLIVGLIFLGYVYFKTLYAASDAIRTLVFIRDPFRKLQLNLLITYMHFLSGLWLAVYFIFLFLF
jgi:cytochrome c oxidase subunit 3